MADKNVLVTDAISSSESLLIKNFIKQFDTINSEDFEFVKKGLDLPYTKRIMNVVSRKMKKNIHRR